jgi:tetratricopeptide (TPR) repeat protein
MKTFRYANALVLAVMVGLGGPRLSVAQTSAVPPSVQAKLMFGKDEKEVDLVGREKSMVFYRPRGGPVGASLSAKLAEITEGEFVVELDGGAASKALMAEDWPAAVALLLPVAMPLLPYLDIPQNNGVGIALQAGQSMMKSARNLMQAGGASMERATNAYVRARQVLKAVGTAEWTPDFELGRLNAVQCLIAIGDLKRAAKELEEARVPDPGDECFGLYWLAQAQLQYAKGKTRLAMDAAVKSLVFDNKNIETFPDALFMTGRCYEDLLEWYRARDVYYEIAKLFPLTSHAGIAREKLKFLMDKGVTKEKEKSAVESVFFGLDEDVNLLVKALLSRKDEVAENAGDEEIQKDADEEAVAADKKEKMKKEGAEPQ